MVNPLDGKAIDARHTYYQAGVVVISKDSDFVELVARYGPPPQLIWVTCGNVTNKKLQAVFGENFPRAMELLASGQAMVEFC